MPLTTEQRSRLAVAAAQGDPQAQVMLDRDRTERQGTPATTPGTGQTPIWSPPAPAADPFTTAPMAPDPILAPQPQRPVTPTPPPPPQAAPPQTWAAQIGRDPGVAGSTAVPTPGGATDPYAGYPMQPPQANQGTALGQAGETVQGWMGDVGEAIGGLFPDQPPNLPPRFGVQPPEQPPPEFSVPPPQVPPRYDPLTSGQPARPFTETPGAPTTPGGGGPPAVNFNAMNAPRPPGLPAFRLPAATVTEAATDPDRQGRSDWGDDLLMLGLGMMAGADPGTGLVGALGTGGLAMMANRSRREADRDDREARRQEREQGQAFELALSREGWDRRDAEAARREAGLMLRAARTGTSYDPERRAQAFWERYVNEHSDDMIPGPPDEFGQATEQRISLDQVERDADRLTRRISPDWQDGAVDPTGEQPIPFAEDTEPEDGRVYLMPDGQRYMWDAETGEMRPV